MKQANAADLQKIAYRLHGLHGAEILKHKHKAKYEFRKPLPDMIGFKQHDSECASDSIQEMMLFADGIREYSQPILHGFTDEQIELRVTMSSDSEDWKRLKDYFHYIQQRFHHHYEVLDYARTHKIKGQKIYDDYEEVCALNPLFRAKQAASIEAAVLALKRYKGEATYSSTGLSFKETVKMIDGFINAMNLPYKRVNGVDKNPKAIVCHGKYKVAVEDGVLKTKSIGHAVSFFKTLDKWVYYDNNNGFLYADDSVIDELRNDNLVIINYKTIRFVKGSPENIVSGWEPSTGKWTKDSLKDLLDAPGKLKKGIYMYHNFTNASVVDGPEPPALNEGHRRCSITEAELKPDTPQEVAAVLAKFRAGIYANLGSNSLIFEDMYKFIYDSLHVSKQLPEVIELLKQTMPTIVLRPACSPMTHYWINKIKTDLKGDAPDDMEWFEIPELKRLGIPMAFPPTPQSLVNKLEEMKEEEAKKSPELVPCGPGQVRDPKTLECKDRVKKTKKNNANLTEEEREARKAKEEAAKKAKEERNKTKKNKPKCEKGEIRDPKTGECVKKREPCPPGQVRDAKTKECRDRFDKACPEGQVRDPKTKECRDIKKYKF